MNKRLQNHGSLLGISALSLGVAALVGPEQAADRISIVSAYLCLLLFAIATLIGPVNVYRKGQPLGNSYLRRDVGIWVALNGLLHFFLANVLAMNYEYLGRFVENAPVPPSVETRNILYAWGTITGYLIAVVFFVLLALSSDRMLRKMGMKWWKRIQRLGYAGFLMTCIHAFAFQALESRAMLWLGVVAVIGTLVLIGQGYGIGIVRRRPVPAEDNASIRT